jgi:hypothetical protein
LNRRYQSEQREDLCYLCWLLFKFWLQQFQDLGRV